MKSILFIPMILFIQLAGSQNNSTCKSLDGVWGHDHPTLKGIWFCNNDRYLWIVLPKVRKQFAAAQPTTEEKAAAYDELSISTGTWACDGKRTTVTPLFSKNPGANNTFQFDYEVKDGKLRYWVLQPDGKRGEERRSNKLATFGPPAKQGCDQMNGFWAYEIPGKTGMFAYANGYFGWILLDQPVADKSLNIQTVEEKAKAYDQILTFAGHGTCDEKLKFTWSRQYAKDYREEGSQSFSDIMIEKDRIQWQVVDKDGKVLSSGAKAVRVK